MIYTTAKPDSTTTASPPPFIVYSLPRSRTFWLSKFLSYGGWACDHDEAVRLRGLDDMESSLDVPMRGYVETAAAPWWRLVQAMRPDIKTVVVRRPVDDVMRSLLGSCGTPFNKAKLRRDMERLDAKLGQIAARVPDALVVTFDELATEAGCARVFEHCLGVPHDPAWWRKLAPVNLTINFPAMVRYHGAHRPQIERMARTATQAILADFAPRKLASDAFAFQQEPFEDFLRDGRSLIARHHVKVGAAPDEAERMNLGLMEQANDLGVLRITTARSNGRMFGYLMTIISPSLESPGKVEALGTAFYADPAAPGIGLKLQRAAMADARDRGAAVMYLRAGVRGDGPRLGALYKRLGAEPFGELYALPLRAS